MANKTKVATHGPHKPWRTKTFHGGKAVMSITDPKTGKQVVIGTFDNVKFVPDYDLKDCYVLGAFRPKDKPLVYDRRGKRLTKKH